MAQPREDRLRPSWRQADLDRIGAALDAALARDPGGWYVAGTSADVGRSASITRTIAGREVAFWRDADGELHAGPGACPHMGALLDGCPVVRGTLRCRWHGLALPSKAAPEWTPYRAYDDGVLVWVQLPSAGEQRSVAPSVPTRPPLNRSISAVISATGSCEPDDVLANRLDPWHGAWLHPYAFSHLTVDDTASDLDRLVVDVAFRLNRTWGVPVRAEFTCPDARTIVMTIVEGEGAGSVVETHATPIGPDESGRARTVMTEATIAYSDRLGFRVARTLSPVIRPAMQHTAHRLWADDLAYAERRYELRRRGRQPGMGVDRFAAGD